MKLLQTKRKKLINRYSLLKKGSNEEKKRKKEPLCWPFLRECNLSLFIFLFFFFFDQEKKHKNIQDLKAETWKLRAMLIGTSFFSFIYYPYSTKNEQEKDQVTQGEINRGRKEKKNFSITKLFLFPSSQKPPKKSHLWYLASPHKTWSNFHHSLGFLASKRETKTKTTKNKMNKRTAFPLQEMIGLSPIGLCNGLKTLKPFDNKV